MCSKIISIVAACYINIQVVCLHLNIIEGFSLYGPYTFPTIQILIQTLHDICVPHDTSTDTKLVPVTEECLSFYINA